MKIESNPRCDDVQTLLASNSLPTQDISDLEMDHFLGCYINQKLIGVVGLEVVKDTALLRSLSVSNELKNQGLGKKLVEKIESRARQINVRELYLLTETAEAYFAALGYDRIDRDLAPIAIKNTREFSDLCADSAVLMKKAII